MQGAKQNVQLEQKQTLVISPQLQQRLKILQCNQQDLELEINQMLEGNIMLERQGEEITFESVEMDNDAVYEVDDAVLQDLPETLDIDTDWQSIDDDWDIQQEYNDSQGFQEDRVVGSPSFDASIERAIYLCSLSDDEKALAIRVLSHLDENYFLPMSLKALAQRLTVDEVILEKVVDVLKHLEPSGVACHDMREYLLVQLRLLDDNGEAVINAYEIISEYFEYLSNKPQLIQRRLGISADEYTQAMDVIRGLSSQPVQQALSTNRWIEPDVFVRERMGVFYASGHKDPRFDLAINEEYAKLAKRCRGDEKHFIQAQLQDAKFFLRALDERNKTILRVANVIVMHQQDYFIEGDKAMQPLTMRVIAELLGLNESTISRAVNGKYLSFNQQLIELRTFFSQDLSDKVIDVAGSSGGREVVSSAISVKATIRELIENENKEKPLSDGAIAQQLADGGLKIARRTVTKYRESLGIAKTSERKHRK